MSNGNQGVFLTLVHHDFTLEAHGHLPSSLLRRQSPEQFPINPGFAGGAESGQGGSTHPTVSSETVLGLQWHKTGLVSP